MASPTINQNGTLEKSTGTGSEEAGKNGKTVDITVDFGYVPSLEHTSLMWS